jgi:hypothetical protein
MRTRTSAVLSETFIQHAEHTVTIKILNTHEILDDYTYVHDILIANNIICKYTEHLNGI